MKRLLIILLSVGVAMSASAQKVIRGGGHYLRGPRVIVTPSFGFGSYYSPFYGYYNPWNTPFGYDNGYRQRPSRLDLQIQDIKTDYADRIKSVRLNHDLSGPKRRQVVRELKTERDRTILQAQKDYYYNRSGKQKPLS